MRILLANKYFYLKGGSEAVFFQQDELLKELGHETIHFSMHDEKNRFSPWQDYFVDPVSYEGKQQSIKQKITAITRMFASREVKHKIRKLIADTKPDIAILHNIYHQQGPSLILELARQGIPMILVAHDAKLVCPAYTLLRGRETCRQCSQGRFYNAAINSCGGSKLHGVILSLESYWQHQIVRSWPKLSMIISPSLFLSDTLKDMGVKTKISLLRNFLAEAVQVEKRADQRPNVGFLGRLSIEKGVDVLLEAAKQNPDIEFRIAGIGPEKDNLLAYQKQEGLTNVSFLNHLNAEELQQEMQTWRLAVFPAIWYENCPMAVLETLAKGIPAIASDLGGLPELVGEAGILVPAGDSVALSNEIAKLWKDSELCDQMGKIGMDFVSKQANKQNYMQQFNQLIHQVAGSNLTTENSTVANH